MSLPEIKIDGRVLDADAVRLLRATIRRERTWLRDRANTMERLYRVLFDGDAADDEAWSPGDPK